MVGGRDPWCLDSTRYYHQKLTEEGIKHDILKSKAAGMTMMSGKQDYIIYSRDVFKNYVIKNNVTFM